MLSSPWKAGTTTFAPGNERHGNALGALHQARMLLLQIESFGRIWSDLFEELRLSIELVNHGIAKPMNLRPAHGVVAWIEPRRVFP
jgi:hypothetical protein